MPRNKTFDETEILTKAVDLFWKKGYHATSVQDLVDHLGINRASLYNTFGDKRALYDKSFTHYRESNRRRIIEFFESAPSVKEAFRTLLKASALNLLNDPEPKGCFIVNSTSEFVPSDDQMQTALTNNRADFEAIFARYIERGIANGELSATLDSKGIAAYLFTVYSGLNVVGKIHKDEQLIMDSIDIAISVLN